jgi:death on curing protein
VNSRSSGERAWLVTQTILAIHDEQLAEHGGAAGVRDMALLEIALARPHNRAACGDADTAELGALYAIAIARNHPFIDGNKRTAYVALESFLAENSFDFTATDADAVLTMLRMAAGEMPDAEFIAWVRQHARRQS